MNDNKNLPVEAEITAIRATAEEAKKLRASLRAKTTIIQKQMSETSLKAWGLQNEFRLPEGPMRIGGTWYV